MRSVVIGRPCLIMSHHHVAGSVVIGVLNGSSRCGQHVIIEKKIPSKREIGYTSVSYTHLDVYKRQVCMCVTVYTKACRIYSLKFALYFLFLYTLSVFFSIFSTFMSTYF